MYTSFLLHIRRNFLYFSSGVPNLFLTMYLLSILKDEHVPLKFILAKRLSEITNIHLILNGTFMI